MSKPAESIRCRNEVQSGCNGLLERFAGASPLSAQKSFHFGESLFNGREIWRIGRQEQETTPSGFDSLPHLRSQMNREVIQDHNLSGLETGSQDLLDVDLKGGTLGCTIQDEGSSYPGERQGGDQRHIGTIIARHLAYCSLSSGSIRIQRGHGNMGAGLIHKDQVATGEATGCRAPSSTFCFFLLTCSYGLFFRVQPRACLARVMEAVLTSIPYVALKSLQCSSRVTSGWASNCALRWTCNTAPTTFGRPGIALGVTLPVSLRCLRYRLMVATETANCSAT